MLRYCSKRSEPPCPPIAGTSGSSRGSGAGFDFDFEGLDDVLVADQIRIVGEGEEEVQGSGAEAMPVVAVLKEASFVPNRDA